MKTKPMTCLKNKKGDVVRFYDGKTEVPEKDRKLAQRYGWTEIHWEREVFESREEKLEAMDEELRKEKIFSKNFQKGVDIFARLCYYILTGRDKSPTEERKETR